MGVDRDIFLKILVKEELIERSNVEKISISQSHKDVFWAWQRILYRDWLTVTL